MDTSVLKLLNTRILSHYEAALKILKGEMPAPRTAILYPTYICNQACPGCEYQDDNNNIKKVMTRRQLFNTIDQLADLGIQGLEFCGGGEPTLHPDLAQAVLKLKEKGISIGLLTNGTRLTGDMAEVAVENLSYIRVSLDAGDEETFNNAKRPKNEKAGFNQVISNLKELVALRRKMKSDVTISIKYLISKYNINGIEKAVKMASALGVDSIQFKGVRIFDEMITSDEAEFIKDKINLLAKHYPDLAVIGSIDKLNMKTRCWLSPVQIMIDALGDVFICCYYRHRKKTHCFGNLFKEPLKEIWYSQKHWDAVKSIKLSECNVLDCRFVVYNEVMHEMMVKDRAQLDFI